MIKFRKSPEANDAESSLQDLIQNVALHTSKREGEVALFSLLNSFVSGEIEDINCGYVSPPGRSDVKGVYKSNKILTM